MDKSEDKLLRPGEYCSKCEFFYNPCAADLCHDRCKIEYAEYITNKRMQGCMKEEMGDSEST